MKETAFSGVFEVGRKLVRALTRQLVPNVGTIVIVILLLFAYNAWASPGKVPDAEPAEAATTGLLSYQGYLADAGGNPLSGDVGITFRLYETTAGGGALWTEAHTGDNDVPVSNGLFNVLLGSLTPISSDVWSNDTLYLGVQVGSDAEMTPREVVGAVPVALRVPEGAIGANQIADGAIDSRNTQLSTGRIQASVPGGVMELTDQLQDVPGTTLTLTPATAQTYLVNVTADFDALNALGTARLGIDDTYAWGSIIFQSYAGTYRERATVSQTYLVNLDPGTHTLVLRAMRNSGTSARIYGIHTTITYLAVSQ